MRRVFCLGGLLPSLLLVGCGGTAPLAPYQSAEGRFKVQMPGGTAQVKDQTGRNGVRTKAFAAEDRSGGFVVVYYDSPVPIPKDGPLLQQMLQAEAQGIYSGLGGTATNSKSITLTTGQQGLEYQANITKPRAGKVRGRTIIDGTRVYNIMAVGAASKVDSADASKFLDSFEITK